MCGIGGILRVWPVDQRELALATPHQNSIPEAWLNILDDSIKHRGPDGHGRFRDRALRDDGCVVDIAFIHRRLSIIDHAGGAQPMVCSSPSPREGPGVGSSGVGPRDDLPPPLLFHGQPNDPVAYRPSPNASRDLVAVVFNGCIYNHRELRAELQHAGHVFTTDHSDTEVLVHGWREWGERLPEHLDGMFAFAIWANSGAVLAFARDRAGEKPIFQAQSGYGFAAFSSTAVGAMRFLEAVDEKFQMENPDPRKLLDPQILASDPSCVDVPFIGNGWRFAKVNQEWLRPWIEYGSSLNTASPPSQTCLPRSMMQIDHRSRDGVRIFTSRFGPEQQPRSAESRLTPEGVDSLIAESVARRMEADVPVACLLSGGVDSSLIARYASLARPGLTTLTVRMPDARYDESSYARRVADVLGTNHLTLDCEPHPARDLERLIPQIGLPFGDSSLLPQLWVCRAASQHAKVLLTGDGADELFGGYERHQTFSVIQRWWRWIRCLPISLIPEDDPKSRAAKFARLVRACRYGGYLQLSAVFPEPTFTQLVSTGRPRWRELLYHGDRDALEIDFDHYLWEDLLCKTDAASMSVPIELRAPFLARDIVQACRSSPLSVLMPCGREGGRKGLLRQVARKYLPAEIVDRPKMGFAIPIGEWFRTDYGGLRTMLLDHLNSTEPFGPPSLGIDLNMPFIRQMLDEHLGTGPSGLVKRDHSQRLYMLLVLSIWAKWMGGLRGE